MGETNSNNTQNSANNSIVESLIALSQTNSQAVTNIGLSLNTIVDEHGGIKISQSSLKDLAALIDSTPDSGNRRNIINRSSTSSDTRSTERFNINRPTRSSSSSSQYSRSDRFDWDSRTSSRRASRIFDSLTDDFEAEFKKALFGSTNPLQGILTKSVQQFANNLGVPVSKLGEELGKRAGTLLKNSDITGPLIKRFEQESNWISQQAGTLLTRGLNNISTALGGEGNIDLTRPFESEMTIEFEQATQEQTASIGDIVSSNLDPISERLDNIESLLRNSGNNSSDIDNVIDTDSIIDENGVERFKDAAQTAQDIAESGLNNADDIADAAKAASKLAKGAQGAADGLASAGQAALTDAASTGALSTVAGELGPVLGEAAGGAEMLAGTAFPVLIPAVIAAAILIDKLSETIGPTVEGFKSLQKAVDQAGDRSLTASKKYTELHKERLKADSESIVKAAFAVIEDSANHVQQVWDSILTTVSATQGYTKSGVQDLWSNYAQRLSEEGLSSVVSSADIMEKLQSVLQSGLSGEVAERFAYEATLLNSAIPTEDFFQYATTYASIAANAMKSGATQAEALDLATEELKTFASNLLYASREIAGGFSASLNNASSLFEESAKIALTSRTGEVSTISGVLTSVSAIVGATAPDLANSIVDAVVRAATGGNSSEITALRSLAGVGASNTAFLQELAKNPQSLFETLFTNLAQLQNMSSANYMEVAEALSSVFGMSMDAFARVDFAYLADAISQMQVNQSSLNENIALLRQGETTSTESQLRMEKINEYMVDQGLAYVLDNEVARSIQEHMWDEQLNRELMDNTFAVDIQGGFLDLVTGLATTVTMISNILNPIGWAKSLGNVVLTAIEADQREEDIAALLQSTQVGKGNETALRNLVAGSQPEQLSLARSYYSLLGVHADSEFVGGLVKSFNALTDPLTTLTTTGLDGAISNLSNTAHAMGDAIASFANDLLSDHSGGGGKVGTATSFTPQRQVNSYYTRQLVSKSATRTATSPALISGDWRDAGAYNPFYDTAPQEAIYRTQAQAEQLATNLQASIEAFARSNADAAAAIADSTEYASTMGNKFYTQSELVAEFANNKNLQQGKTFEDWIAQFEQSSEFKSLTGGDSTLAQELENYGYTLDSLRAIYEQQELAQASASTKAREAHEVQFWEDMQRFSVITFPNYFDTFESYFTEWKNYFNEWKLYYIEHEAYTQATNEAYKQAINLKDEEKNETGDSVLALAQALTENSNWQESLGNAIKDPVVQTNTLLAKILLVVEAIMQQNNEVAVTSVPLSLASLGLGTTNVSSSK